MWQPGESGNPGGRQKDKPFRDALRMELADADGKALRRIAASLIDAAEAGNTLAIREIADRIDGKVPQAVVGDDEHDPIRVESVTDEQRKAAVAALLGQNVKP